MSLFDNAPALVVFCLIFAAPIVAIVRSGTAAWLLTLIAVYASLVSIFAAFGAVDYFALSYPMGNWFAPIGIEYRVDRLSGFLHLVVGVLAALIVPYARKQVEREIPVHKRSMFYAIFLLCLAGLQGMIATHDAFNLYVFLEISSLATYTLIAMGKDRRALSSSFQYLILGTVGATFILIGIGLIYMMTGTLNMSDLHMRLLELHHTRAVQAAFAFIMVGVSMKIALFPLHMWLPNAYAYAPNAVTAFLAGTATKVSIYAMLRFMFSVFGYEFSFTQMPTGNVLILLAIPAILIGSLVAIYQPNLKRMLAYSSIAQVGYIALGIGLATVDGLTAALTHVANHALAKAALFMVLGAVAYRLYEQKIERVRLADIAGLSKAMPVTCLAFVFAGLALMGVPLSGGFISKWMLIDAVMDARFGWIGVIVVIAGSLLAILYIWRVVDQMYFAEPAAHIAQMKEAPIGLLVPIWLMVLASYYVGIDTEYTLGYAADAADYLMDLANIFQYEPSNCTLIRQFDAKGGM